MAGQGTLAPYFAWRSNGPGQSMTMTQQPDYAMMMVHHNAGSTFINLSRTEALGLAEALTTWAETAP